MIKTESPDLYYKLEYIHIRKDIYEKLVAASQRDQRGVEKTMNIALEKYVNGRDLE